MSTADHGARRNRLRAGLPDGVAGLLVTGHSNIRYLSGFSGSNGALLVGAVAADDRLATDSRYVVQAAEQVPDLEVVPGRHCAEALLVHAAKVLTPLAFEAEHVSVAAYGAWIRDLPDDALRPTTGLVEGLRIAKDDAELALLAQACRISDEALAALMGEIRPGLTERWVARRLEQLMLERGAEAASFETIVATGPHSAIPHHRPTDRAIAAGDLLKIDFGALVGGYHADETRTFVVGAPPADWQRELHDLVRLAQAAGVAALAVGARLRGVDAVARDLITAAGHGGHFGHGLGHGVGLDIHEAPMIGSSAAGTLGDCTPVTVEPGVYLPGRGGVRIEDTLVVRAGATESLTATTRDLTVLG